MKVLVTGGSGFIGSHVVDKLRDKGVGVRVFDMIIPTYRDDVEFCQGSLIDYDAVRMAMMGVDAVFHLAAVADVNEVVEDPHFAESINVRGTINILEAARKNGEIRRIILGSTTWVYSDTKQELITEETPLSPPSHLYTATKMAAEYYCKSYENLYGLNTTILRYGIPYGIRARDGAVIPIFVRKALKGEPITITGDGSQYRKFVYVEDLADGNVLALRKVAEGNIYNLEGDENITIKQIAETIKSIIGDVEIKYVPARTVDFGGKNISNEKAKDELKWTPKTSFREGVEKYIKWFKDRDAQRKEDWDKVDETLR
jgi:UDP-glucose 4-epimerase